MTRVIERLGDRLLARLVPARRAAAGGCYPCGGAHLGSRVNCWTDWTTGKQYCGSCGSC
ncbi:hypothetical protein [Streptosporangium carneum]|uniref:Uncharacterized protein n=1 Tax=Streptosporangium carneum TaxID=47481 RepID=A0A9W6HZW0_9ACTN|nr:hypothetical protein [Streptosporangium carneum]GLK09435.1 hypothetical protein GCM10017600_28410 [Streptosporangium carneum]